MTNKKIIANFLQKEYSDQALCNLLCAAEDGNVIYEKSAMCLLGRSNHGYFGRIAYGVFDETRADYEERKEAEHAFLWLSREKKWYEFWKFDRIGHEERNAALVPIIRAEIARRDKEREVKESLDVVEFQSTPEIKVRVKTTA